MWNGSFSMTALLMVSLSIFCLPFNLLTPPPFHDFFLNVKFFNSFITKSLLFIVCGLLFRSPFPPSHFICNLFICSNLAHILFIALFRLFLFIPLHSTLLLWSLLSCPTVVLVPAPRSRWMASRSVRHLPYPWCSLERVTN